MRTTTEVTPAVRTEPTGRPRVAIITGSTRPGRKAGAVARWILDIAARRDDAEFEVVDIADYALPHLDEPMPPRNGRYDRPHTRAWARKIGSADAFVFVTPEYNGSIPGALKDALDFLYAEWNGKAAGLVGYGIQGGTRAVGHLRQVLGDLVVTDVRSAVALTFADDFQDYTRFTPSEPQAGNVTAMLDELIACSDELRKP
ncbi:NADPH-dependent FMN reductase [Actinomadura sp. WMMA1423]|uniref:NADPH-dependent FMN reductase n=1 Tax=Actinomadura sp. WMMA1423 TaxID=2591108 RepID=UPI0011464ED7|nr:NAD(P)H-dependent oxidoreductase [Actinomadura sp. WMMA1423]